MSTIRTGLIGLGVAGAVAIGAAVPGIAAPVPSSTAAVKHAAPSDVVDVWHRRRWRRHAPAAFALGVLGTIAAAEYYDRRHRYYRYRYDYPHPYAYAYPYPYRYGPGW